MLKNALPKIITETLPGPKAKDVLDRRMKTVTNAIRPGYPVVIARGEGAMIEDVDGNIFLDWIGGVGVLNIGYSRPELINAVRDQSEKYFHTMFGAITHERYVELAEKLINIVPLSSDRIKVMFTNSGAECAENAIKIARSYTKRPNVIVFSGAFHGRTMLAMTMTAAKKYAVGMGPFPDGVCRAEYPYLYRGPSGMTESEAIDYYIGTIEKIFIEQSPPEYVAAIVFEPIQGEGGFVPAPIEWVKAIRDICNKYKIIMISDEVQCAWSRSGRMFASEYFKDAGFAPDMLTTAKSIAGGLPLSAVIGTAEIMDNVTPGTIGGTYGGNPIACAAALQVINVMQKEDFPRKAREIGDKCMLRFNEWKEKYEVIGDCRGKGAMIAVEFVKSKKTKEPYPEIVKAIIAESTKNGLLLLNAGVYDNVIRFLAPLCITDMQVEAGLNIFESSIIKCINEV